MDKKKSDRATQRLTEELRHLEHREGLNKENGDAIGLQLKDLKRIYGSLLEEYEKTKTALHEIEREKNRFRQLYRDLQEEFDSSQKMDAADRQELRKLRDNFGKLRVENAGLLSMKIDESLSTGRPGGSSHGGEAHDPKGLLKGIAERMQNLRRGDEIILGQL